MTIDNLKYITPTTGASTSSSTYVAGSTTVGGEETLLIADMTSRELLEAILIELKIMNLRQEAVWGEPVNSEDLKNES